MSWFVWPKVNFVHKSWTDLKKKVIKISITFACCMCSRQCRQGIHSSQRSLVAEEVRLVQSRHRRVLGELNLSVEAMLMPTMADNNDPGKDEQDNQDQREASTEELLASVNRTDELLSPVGCDKDSGFSGSSNASYRWVCHFSSTVLDCSNSLCFSYRSGLGSLRRGFDKTSNPELNDHSRRNKAAMIWKKGWKGWKKLHSFGSTGLKNGESRVNWKFCLRALSDRVPRILTRIREGLSSKRFLSPRVTKNYARSYVYRLNFSQLFSKWMLLEESEKYGGTQIRIMCTISLRIEDWIDDYKEASKRCA